MTTTPVGVYGVVGGSASLSCIASGAPTPSLFTWFRDGIEVDVENTVTFPSETSAKSEVSSEDCLNAFFLIVWMIRLYEYITKHLLLQCKDYP